MAAICSASKNGTRGSFLPWITNSDDRMRSALFKGLMRSKTVRIFGETYPVRAKLFTINGLSAHADHDALLAWLGRFRRPPAQTWVVHGEPLAANTLRDDIERRYGWRAAVATAGLEWTA